MSTPTARICKDMYINELGKEVHRSWTYVDQALDELLPSLVLPLVAKKLKGKANAHRRKMLRAKKRLPTKNHMGEIDLHVDAFLAKGGVGDLAAWLAKGEHLSKHIQAFVIFVVALAESSGLVGAPRWKEWAADVGAKDLWWQLAALLGLVVAPVERDAAKWRVDRATTLRLLRSPLLGAADAVAALEATAESGDYPAAYDGLRAVLAAVGLDAAAVYAHEREAATYFPAYAPTTALAKSSTLRAFVLTQKQGELVKEILLFGNMNVKSHNIQFIKCSKDGYVFSITHGDNKKILILQQDMFVWNRFP